MKKLLFLSLLFVCLTVCFGACTKRDKLLNNTMILQIEPAEDLTLSVGDYKELEAVIKNIKMENISEPVRWSVSCNEAGDELGSFSSKTLKNTIFTAEERGKGTITLFCQGVTVSINITIS
ncbi:hypothetical protein [Candidatus Ruminimicrobiellum ovillum]|uniref:hypothetical protein n=1 Tax=Candidatus Ruminimicrobiellum ovillum TaxID=1947927 RepID=UPI00355948E2